MILKPALDGLVLAGGQSSRMGEAKAWLCFSDVPQWQAGERVLASVCEQIYFSVSPKLTKALPVEPFFLVKDVFSEPCGPLGGIISAFHRNPDRALLVLACDMPNFDERAAQFLVEHRNNRRMATVFLNQNGGVEPLCAVYEPAIFSLLLKCWSQKVFCPRKILSELDVERVVPENYSWLMNVNERDDLLAMLPGKKVTLHFYASLRVEAQCSSVEIVSKASSLDELFREMRTRFNFSLDQKSVRFAKNHQLVESSSSLSDGDTIVFMPPVSGG